MLIKPSKYPVSSYLLITILILLGIHTGTSIENGKIDYLDYSLDSENLNNLFFYFLFHKDFAHLIGNIFILYTLGCRLELRTSNLAKLLIFIVGGIGGGVAFLVFIPDGKLVGASASLSAVICSFLIILPSYRGPIPFFDKIFSRVPYWPFIIVWIMIEYGRVSNSTGLDGEIIYNGSAIAHLGGGFAGVVSGIAYRIFTKCESPNSATTF